MSISKSSVLYEHKHTRTHTASDSFASNMSSAEGSGVWGSLETVFTLNRSLLGWPQTSAGHRHVCVCVCLWWWRGGRDLLPNTLVTAQSWSIDLTANDIIFNVCMMTIISFIYAAHVFHKRWRAKQNCITSLTAKHGLFLSPLYRAAEITKMMVDFRDNVATNFSHISE